MAYTDEDLQKITVAVKNALVNDGTDTQAVTEATDISLVDNLLGHDSRGELLRITPSNIHKDIIARIQGTSENSTAMRDPFKFAGSYTTATIGDLREWLDSLHGTDYTLDNRGVYRAILNDSVIEITSSPINYTTEQYLQVVRGRVSLDSTGLLTFSNEYHIFERQYTSTDGWSAWRVAAGANTIENLKVALDEIPDLIDAAIESGRKLALRDLFVAAGAEYNDTSADITKTAPWGESVTHKAGHYYLNGLGDITEEQMMDIYNAPHNAIYPLAYTGYANDKNVRTLIFRGTGGHAALNGVSIASIFNSCLIETLNFRAIYGLNCNFDTMFRNCTKLTHLQGTIFCQNCSVNQIFYKCVNLKTVDVQRLSKDISFSDSAELSKNSVLNMINNVRTTSAITITLHADAYARLATDADIVAALEAQPLVTLVSA